MISEGERKRANLSGLSPEEKRARKRKRDKEWNEAHRDREREYKRTEHDRLKREVFSAYGGKCECCEEADLHFLTIDHVAQFVPPEHKHPSGRRISGTAFLRLLKKEGYPDSCRILCWNCNCSHAYYGFCPHQPHDTFQRRY